MRADWSPGCQQFLGHDIAFEHVALAAAIALGPSHADPAARAEPPAECRRAMAAEIAVRHPQPRRELPGDKLAHLGSQSLACGRQLDRIKTEGGGHFLRTIRLAPPVVDLTIGTRDALCRRAPRAGLVGSIWNCIN